MILNFPNMQTHRGQVNYRKFLLSMDNSPENESMMQYISGQS